VGINQKIISKGDYMITSKVERITPNRAKEMMTGSNCRRLRQKKLLNYASDMSKGRWKLTGSSIIYDKNGKLIDGFHRLNAVKLSGVPIQSVIVRGVEPEVVGDIDIGAVRTGGDFLYIKEGPDNIKYERAISAALNIIYWYKTNKFQGRRTLIDNDEIYACYKENEGIQESINKAWANKCSLLSAAQLGAFHYLFSKKDEELADKFLSQMSNGISDGVNDPFHRLREKLVDRRSARTRIDRQDLVRLIVMAWNLKRKGKTTARLHYKKGKHSVTII
jgi:hypothetical protein